MTSTTSKDDPHPAVVTPTPAPTDSPATATAPTTQASHKPTFSLPSWIPSSLFTIPYHVLFPPASPPNTLPVAIAGQQRSAWRARKLLFRASLVTLSCFILLLEPVTQTVMGNASFFACIVSVMLPPMMPVMMFFFAMTTLVLGMLVGWAWSCAAMAASLVARNKVLLASQLQRVNSSLAGQANPDQLYQVKIFEGNFLDARSTVVFGVFFFVGTFIFGYMRAKIPKLTLLAIFGTIVTDVMVSYGPLFPFAQYTLAISFLIPTSFYLAIAMASNFLIFPQTLNSSWTYDLIDKVLVPTLERSILHSSSLSSPPPTVSAEPWGALSKQMDASGAKLSAGIEGLLGSVGMMELEVSFGRLSAKDLKGLLGDLRDLHARAMGLVVFVHRVDATKKARDAHDVLDQHQKEEAEHPTEGENPDHFQPKATPRVQKMREQITHAEKTYSHDLASLLPILESASSTLRSAGDDALLGGIEWLVRVNGGRWSFKSSSEEAVIEEHKIQKNKVEEFRVALEEFRTTRRKELCEPFERFFDKDTGKMLPPSSTTTEGENGEKNDLAFSPASLFLCFTATTNLIWYSEALLKFLEGLEELEGKRGRNKLWWPTGLRKLGNHILGKGVVVVGGGVGNPEKVEPIGDEDTVVGEDEGGKKVEKENNVAKATTRDFRRDPDARAPRNKTQKFSLKLYNFGVWLKQAETVFAIKYATVSILIWLPQIFPSSAYFTYTNKGLWALIMAQTGLAVYSGDQISQMIQKFIGTLAGLVYGMLIWYIGAGHGLGSRPGLGAALYTFFLPPLAMRLFAPPQYSQSAVIGGVTVILVVGYSWQNGHVVTLGSPGVGVNLAWRRALLVIIGMTAAGIIMMFPSPQSARLLVRRTHATCVDEVSRLYVEVIGAWLAEERIERSGNPDNEDEPFSETAQNIFKAQLLALMVKLRGIRTYISQAGFEVSLRGDWPAEEYGALLTSQLATLEALAQLGVALVRLDGRWRRKLVTTTAFLNSNLISDVTSTFALVSMALRSGSPLPENTSGPLLERLLYHETSRRSASASAQALAEEHSHHKVNGASTGTILTFTALEDEHFCTYSTALLALSAILHNLDEIEASTKKLVGVVLFPGFERVRGIRGEV